MKEIDRLDKRSKEMIILKFGLDGERPLTFKEIGQINNLSRQRIEQISSVAIQKLSKRRSIKELHGGL
jgi:RNA polymerase primary sigma factor